MIDITGMLSARIKMTGVLLCRLDDIKTVKETHNKIIGQMNQDCICQLLMWYGAPQLRWLLTEEQ